MHLFRFLDHEIPVMGEKIIWMLFLILFTLHELIFYMQDICSFSIQEEKPSKYILNIIFNPHKIFSMLCKI